MKKTTRKRRIFIKKGKAGRKPKRHFSSHFERITAGKLIDAGVPFEYEDTRVDYLKQHIYYPDFNINNGKFYVETKGRFLPSDRSKHLLVRAQHPELDIRFVFMQDNKLNPRSDKRYSDWCNHHGFKYAFKEIPKEWLDEATSL